MNGKKNNKRALFLILFGLLFGVLIGTLPAKIENSKQPKEQQIPVEKTKQPDNQQDNRAIQLAENQQASVNLWESDSIYNKDDQVIYKNKTYRAKWWTQGEKPDKSGEYDVWEYVGESSNKKIRTAKKGDTIAKASTKKDTTKATESKDKSFKVIAYYPSWKTDGLDKIDYSIVTHINYAFAIPKSNATLKPLENESTAKKIIAKAHKKGVKVLLSVGGWSDNGALLEPVFMEATNTQKKRDKFVKAILSMCDKYGFDGIDMDWEHPRMDGSSKNQYEAVMLSLSKQLKKRDKLLTTAVLSGVTNEGTVYYDAKAQTNKVLNAVDFINIMAYDGGDGERHSSYSFAKNCAKYWKEIRKLPKEKVVLGIPFYGRPSWAVYEELLKNDKTAYKKDITTYNGMEVYYNGINTVKKKTSYAKGKLGGVMIWEITQDTSDQKKSLLRAIKEVITSD